jgi:hypothetical protein
MHIIRFTLSWTPEGASPSQAFAEAVRELLWAHALPETGLEHVTVIPLPRGVHVALFQRHDTQDPAARLRDLVDSVAWPPELVGPAALPSGGRSRQSLAPALQRAAIGRWTARL